jgi:hypothetical protein
VLPSAPDTFGNTLQTTTIAEASLQCRTPSFDGSGSFAVAALSERRNSLRIQDRRSETAATKIKLTHYPFDPAFDRDAAVEIK